MAVDGADFDIMGWATQLSKGVIMWMGVTSQTILDAEARPHPPSVPGMDTELSKGVKRGFPHRAGDVGLQAKLRPWNGARDGHTAVGW